MKHKKTIIIIIIVAILLIIGITTLYTKINKQKLNVDNEYSNITSVIDEKKEIITIFINKLDSNNKTIIKLKKELEQLDNSYDVKNKCNCVNEIDIIIQKLNKDIQNKKITINEEEYKTFNNNIKNANKKLLNKKDRYNKTVKNYNNMINKFPYIIIAKIFKFQKINYYI